MRGEVALCADRALSHLLSLQKLFYIESGLSTSPCSERPAMVCVASEAHRNDSLLPLPPGLQRPNLPLPGVQGLSPQPPALTGCFEAMQD